jgi:predicted PurR-regulated permease PerM
VKRIPIFGSRVSGYFEPLVVDKHAFVVFLKEHQDQVIDVFTSAAKSVFSTILTIVTAIVACYFLYRHGPELAAQLAALVPRLGGEPIDHLLETVNVTVRGAAYGVVVTAVVQGVLAGIGYLVAGAPVPIVLGLATMVFPLVPFGPPFLYLPVSGYLVASGLPWYQGVGLALWGLCVVSMADNILRPLFISQATQVSIVLVFIGVIGGVMSFGLLGVFLGPAIVAVAQRLWHDYACEARPAVVDK